MCVISSVVQIAQGICWSSLGAQPVVVVVVKGRETGKKKVKGG